MRVPVMLGTMNLIVTPTMLLCTFLQWLLGISLGKASIGFIQGWDVTEKVVNRGQGQEEVKG